MALNILSRILVGLAVHRESFTISLLSFFLSLYYFLNTLLLCIYTHEASNQKQSQSLRVSLCASAVDAFVSIVD